MGNNTNTPYKINQEGLNLAVAIFKAKNLLMNLGILSVLRQLIFCCM